MDPEIKPNTGTDKNTALINKVIKVFHKTTGLDIDIEKYARDKVDAIGDLRLGDIVIKLAIEAKLQPTKAYTGYLYQKFTRNLPADQGLLVADYINPVMAERLKDHDIWFLDLAGNAYINKLPVYIYIKGNKPAEPAGKEPRPRAFQPMGLKVIFALLCQPEWINLPYREIARIADVALGTVGWIIADLKDMGYIVEIDKRKRRLKKLKKLFDRWVEAYPEQLRPKLLIGRYTTTEPLWWKNTKIKKMPVYLGGEIAAEYLTNYLTPEVKTVYVREKPQNLQLAFKMRKDPQGEIELFEAFWNTECDYINKTDKAKETAHPILIYADLLATGDPRNIETAEIIYDNTIAGHLRED
jgi:hypothetical protein